MRTAPSANPSCLASGLPAQNWVCGRQTRVTRLASATQTCTSPASCGHMARQHAAENIATKTRTIALCLSTPISCTCSVHDESCNASTHQALRMQTMQLRKLLCRCRNGGTVCCTTPPVCTRQGLYCSAAPMSADTIRLRSADLPCATRKRGGCAWNAFAQSGCGAHLDRQNVWHRDADEANAHRRGDRDQSADPDSDVPQLDQLQRWRRVLGTEALVRGSVGEVARQRKVAHQPLHRPAMAHQWNFFVIRVARLVLFVVQHRPSPR